LSQHIGGLITGLSSERIGNTLLASNQRDLAGLDLKMLEAAIIHSQGAVPSKLSELVDVFSEESDQPKGLSYEEIIMINPRDDMRRFTRGETGETETKFYNGHKDIEANLDNAIIQMLTSISLLSQTGASAIEHASASTALILKSLELIIGTMHQVGAQNKDHFNTFRPYFGSHPTRETKGPSGAFTAGFPTLELLLAGKELPEDHANYLRENRLYFPRAGRVQIDSANELVQNNLTLLSFCKQFDNPPQLTSAIGELGNLLRRFRGEHYKAVKHQVPEALSGSVAGSGGEQMPGEFLRSRMRIRYR